jgi:hypothetical protein
MMILVQKLNRIDELITAVVVGAISFATRNLSIALIFGLLVEQSFIILQRKQKAREEKI